MELWIPFTLAAAFLQNLRSVLQRRLKGRLSTSGAAFSRFVYALPLAWAALGLWVAATGEATPAPPPVFWAWAAAGGLSQILFTVVLLWMFSFRSFAVGTTFSKLEVLMVAALGAVLLGDGLSGPAVAAIALGALGAAALGFSETRLTPGALLRGLGERATGAGLLCAALLGASSVFFRGATLSLEGASTGMAALFALACALTLQTAMMGAWFAAAERAQGLTVLREWRAAAPAGAVGMACSACWFTAFTLQNAAYVRALGQVELLFAFASGALIFRERISRAEGVGVALIGGAIVLLLLAG
ncbi:MAG: hypothetical protein AAF192_10695 [Pseudomonadota bacterium]